MLNQRLMFKKYKNLGKINIFGQYNLTGILYRIYIFHLFTNKNFESKGGRKRKREKEKNGKGGRKKRKTEEFGDKRIKEMRWGEQKEKERIKQANPPKIAE